MNKVWQDAETRYRIDRVRENGEVDEWFYNSVHRTKALAQKYINERNPKSYRGKLRAVKYTTEAGYVYQTTLVI